MRGGINFQSDQSQPGYIKTSITTEVKAMFLRMGRLMGGMAKDKFLLVSLKDDEAKRLAQVITNDTSRKILDFLSESESTETQIAQALGVPLPTVHYNLKALEGAKLVVCEQFHYSSKGREVNHYKLANKYIIIAPASTYGIKEKLRSLLPVVPVIGGGALALEWYASMQSRAASFSAAPMEALRTAAPIAADTMGGLGYQAENEAAQRIASAGAEAAPTIAQKAVEAGPMISQQATIDHVSTVATQTGGYWSIAHPGLWLLIGAIVTVGLWFTVDYIRSNKR